MNVTSERDAEFGSTVKITITVIISTAIIDLQSLSASKQAFIVIVTNMEKRDGSVHFRSFHLGALAMYSSRVVGFSSRSCGRQTISI